MANDIVRFANSVEYVTGKKRGRKPVFSATQFYPYTEERVLQGATRNEFMRFIEEAYAKATVGVVIMDDISELYDFESDFPETFKEQVVSSANAIARKALNNFANQSEMIIGKPYYPSEVKGDILTSWESNFMMQCRSAEDDVKKDMARIIQQAKDEGWNKKQLEKAVKAELPEKYKYRAELIARTETAKLNSRVNRETYKEIGIQYYTWMTTLDGRERSSHANMNNLICSVDNPNVYYEETENGLVEHERSGDMVHLHPGEDFQCRCSMVMWDPMLQGQYAVKQEPEQEPEEKPKSTAAILREVQEQLELARNQLEGANRKNEILQIAQARHAARTQAEREETIRRLNNRLEVRKLTHEVLKEAEGINGIGVEELTELMKGGSKKQYVAMNEKAKEIRSKIEELRNMKHVQNPIKVAKDFDYMTAVGVEKSVERKLKAWDYENLSLENRKKKLEFEIKWLEDNKKYSSWEVAQKAYRKLLSDVEKDIKLEPIVSEMASLKQYASTHKRFTNFGKWVGELEKMLSNKAQFTENEFETLYEKLLKERTRIMGFDPKPASGIAIIDNATCRKMYAEFENIVDERRDKQFRPLTEKIWGGLSEEEKTVLTKYTETYNYLNEPLRGKTYYGSIKGHDKDVKNLTKAIEKSVVPEDIVVIRGTGDFTIKAINKDLSDLKVGDRYVELGFLSTAVTAGGGLGGSYKLRIVIPKGTKAIYAEPFSHYTDSRKFTSGIDGEKKNLWDGKTAESMRDERELLVQRGSTLEVVDVKGHNIYMKLVDQQKF